MSDLKVERGDIYYVNLDPVVGCETGKTRPVLVIQNDIGNSGCSGRRPIAGYPHVLPVNCKSSSIKNRLTLVTNPINLSR